MAKVTLGDPMQPGADMSSQVSGEHAGAHRGMSRGPGRGRTGAGGRRPADLGTGYLYKPTVLTGCRQEMEIVRDENIRAGPAVLTFHDFDEAIALANDCQYGLTSSVYTRSVSLALAAVNRLRFGETYVNRENFEAMQGFHAGWRKSGIGGADGKHGLMEYLQSHVAYIQY